jgi:hypothetical protein
MRFRGVSLVFVAVLALAGCTPGPEVPESPSASPNPVGEPALLGQSALPLGCSDLIAPTDLSAVYPGIAVAIDEQHVAQDMTVALVQSGALACAWSNDFGATGTHGEVRLTVALSAATSLDPAIEPVVSVIPWSLVAGPHPTVATCMALESVGSCDQVQLRGGYRVDLSVVGNAESAEQISALSAGLLEHVGAAIDDAPAPRILTEPVGTTDPAALCVDPAIEPITAARGATGTPVISTDAQSHVTRCSWQVGGVGHTVEVAVLPGGSWAFEALAGGVGSFPLWYELAPDGDYLVGEGDWLGAFRVIGDDLVQITAPNGSDDPVAWEALLAQTW